MTAGWRVLEALDARMVEAISNRILLVELSHDVRNVFIHPTLLFSVSFIA